MQVARLFGAGDLRLVEEPAPGPPPPDHSTVAVSAVGICGSDLHWFSEGAIGDARLTAPLALGHEMGGRALSGPYAGQRVAIDPAIPCEHCATCRAGDANLCPDVVFAGHGGCDGGLREIMTWPTRLLHPVPDELGDAAVAALEPLGVAIHAVDLSHLRLGATVAVVGCGPIGIFLIELARLCGAARVIAVEPLEHRRRGLGQRRSRRRRPRRRPPRGEGGPGRDPRRRPDDVHGLDRPAQGPDPGDVAPDG